MASKQPPDHHTAESSTTSPEGSTDESPTARAPNRSGELSLDVMFNILSNNRRRLILRYLNDVPKTSLSTLAEHVASIENNKSKEALSRSERKRVYVGLYQGHLPKMNDAGIIDYNQSSGTVVRKETADAFNEYLGLSETTSPNTTHRQFLLSLLIATAIISLALSFVLSLSWPTALLIGSLLALLAVVVIRRKYLLTVMSEFIKT